MNILKNFWGLLISPRFVSFYWRSGGMFAAGFLDLILSNMQVLNLPNMATLLIGLIIPELTKAISNHTNNKPMGFMPK